MRAQLIFLGLMTKIYSETDTLQAESIWPGHVLMTDVLQGRPILIILMHITQNAPRWNSEGRLLKSYSGSGATYAPI